MNEHQQRLASEMERCVCIQMEEHLHIFFLFKKWQPIINKSSSAKWGMNFPTSPQGLGSTEVEAEKFKS